MTPTLRVEGVSKAFGSIQAVDRVSLEVRTGEVFGLLGPNGAGKTTLIRMILDIYRPDSGSIEVFGHTLTRQDLDGIGYLPEERGLYRRRKVVQVLSYLGQLKGLSKADSVQSAEHWLEKLGMSATRDAPIETLSKGNQQKIQLISTLLTQPSLLVWDEPFSGLDPVNVVRVRDLISEQKSLGTTVVLSTHLMDQAEALCDRVALIHSGRVVLNGPVEQLRTESGAEAIEVQTRARLAAGSEWPMVAQVQSDEPVKGSEERLYTLTLAEQASAEDLLRLLLQRSEGVSLLRPRRPNLEEIFLDAVHS